jgi:hypothetical protein
VGFVVLALVEVAGAVTSAVRSKNPGGQMKALVMKQIGQVGFIEKPIPRPGPGDAIVRTTRALICTSDSHTARLVLAP